MKTRWGRDEAEEVAAEIVDLMLGTCERIEVAGSVRRRKPDVGDVEIVFAPKVAPTTRPGEMFPVQTSLAHEMIDSLIGAHVLGVRELKDGRTSKGEQNMLLCHCRTGMPVDFFATTEECWWNYLVCRTGGKLNNIDVCNAARAKGWKWNPYGPGFTKENGEIVPARSEAEVFSLVGMAWKEPWERE